MVHALFANSPFTPGKEVECCFVSPKTTCSLALSTLCDRRRPESSYWSLERMTFFQIFVDWWGLNATIIPNTNLLLRIEDCIDRLKEAQMITALDTLYKYWHVPIKDEDKEANTFISHNYPHSETNTPLGLHIAPATFHLALDIILSKVWWKTGHIDIEETIIFSKNNRQHVKNGDKNFDITLPCWSDSKPTIFI